MTEKNFLDLLTLLSVFFTMAMTLALALTLHYQIHAARLERLRFKRAEFIRVCVNTIRNELHKAGFYELKNKADAGPGCKEIIHGMRVLCLVFVAADDNFSVSAFQTRCFEGNPVFDDEVETTETVKGKL